MQALCKVVLLLILLLTLSLRDLIILSVEARVKVCMVTQGEGFSTGVS